MKRTRKLLVAATAVALFAGAIGLNPAAAQDGPNAGAGNPRPNVGFIGVCSTTDTASVAAGALGITASELRIALVGGKTLEQIATEKGVELTAVEEALKAARLADIDQAVTDGLLTEEQATALKSGLEGNTPAADPNQPVQPNQPNAGNKGNNPQGRPGIGIPTRNVAHPMIAAANALGMTCGELVKATLDSKSVADVAAEKGVSLQTVVDAVKAEFEAAIDKDLAEGLIAQAEVARIKGEVLNRALDFLSGRDGQRGQMGGQPGQPGQVGQPGQQGQKGQGGNN